MLKKKIPRSYILIIALVLIFTNSCKKEDKIPEVTFNPSIKYGSVKDQDGNTYKTVTIGTQVWMAENLKTTKYRNGDSIPNITDNNQWEQTTSAGYCNYYNDINYSDTYGRLYNWYAVNDSNNLAPQGWHVATDAEWTTLITYLGGDSLAGPKLKETGDRHWFSFDETNDATNESGFTALPCGYRNDIFLGQSFHSICLSTRWWSSTQYNSTRVWTREIDTESNLILRSSFNKFHGYSVRCVKD